jgi:hypothetical protein
MALRSRLRPAGGSPVALAHSRKGPSEIGTGTAEPELGGSGPPPSGPPIAAGRGPARREALVNGETARGTFHVKRGSKAGSTGATGAVGASRQRAIEQPAVKRCVRAPRTCRCLRC